jgi:hypothetical protein
MLSMRRYLLFFCAFCGICLPTDAGEFYLKFLSLVDTNQRPLRPITFQALVDTNNTESKITNAAVDLDRLRLDAGISGVRVGMTMDEAIARWGKPKGGYSPGCLHGLTTFFYSDVALGFEGDRLETIQITPPRKLGGGLSSESKVQDFVRVLGPSTNRRDGSSDSCNLVYLSAAASLRLDFYGEELMNIYLERSASRAEPWKGTGGVNQSLQRMPR